MKMGSVSSALMVVGSLLVLSACSDNDVPFGSPPPPAVTATRTATVVPTAVPTRTATSAPTATATVQPSATATQPATATNTVAPTATPTELATTTPTDTASPTATQTVEATATPTTQVGLGTHVFTIFRNGFCAALGDANSCFFTSALPSEVGMDPWLPGPLRLVAGEPDGNGVAQVSLAEDVIIGFKQPLSAQCFKLFAAGTTGRVDCDGGSPNDVSVTFNSNGADPGTFPPTFATDLGADGGPGALTLVVMMASVSAPTVNDCATATFGAPNATPFTTGTGTAMIENPVQGSLDPLLATGVNIPCETWSSGGGTAGRLVVPLTSENIPVLAIDAEAIMQLQEQ